MSRSRGARGKPAALLFVLLIAGLAGCTSGSGSSTTTIGDGSQEQAEGGVLRGLVITEELTPVEGAQVAAEGVVAAATTDEAGRFELRGLPSGTIRVTVLALGFESVARDVLIEGLDAVVEVQFTLARLAVIAPYIELLITNGYEICTLTLGVLTSRVSPCPLGTHNASHVFRAKDSWRYLVVESDWKTADSMWLFVSHNRGCNTGDPCWAQRIGRAPLRVDGAPGDVALAKRYALDEKKTFPEEGFQFFTSISYAGLLRDEINGTFGPTCNTVIITALGPLGQQWNRNLGCGLGYGFSTGIRFTNYVSIFHWERPARPLDYSGMPDQ